MLDLDLMQLGTWKRFERFCHQLTKTEFPGAFSTRGSWDGGRDVVVWHVGAWNNDIVWQCKFTEDLGSTTQRAISKSVRAAVAHYDEGAELFSDKLAEDPDWRALVTKRADERGTSVGPPRLRKWILCIPVARTATFMDWLRLELEPYPFEWEVWDRPDLLERLEVRDDLLDRYFYPVYAELQRHFQREELALMRFEFDASTQQEWVQADPAVLEFATKGTHDPDLVLDVILRNSGQVETMVTEIAATVEHATIKPHGIPGAGLLHSQITYGVSLGRGAEGSYITKCEPPLVVRGHGLERCKIRLSDTGYSWRGTVRLSLAYGAGKRLFLPHIGLYT
jgi:hypothetical protein